MKKIYVICLSRFRLLQLQPSKNIVREYFQIDLLNLTEVTAIATQVRSNENDIKLHF